MTRTSLPARLVAIALAVALAGGCAGTDTDTAATETSTPPSIDASTDTSAPSSTDTSASDRSTDDETPEDAVQALLDDWTDTGQGGVAVALATSDDELTLAAAGSAGPGGGLVEPESAFRVGSVSKTFVAVMLLQLVDDGTIALDDQVVAHAPDLTIADGVTIRQLLAHRSGIPEHVDRELSTAVLADPSRTWTPTDALDLVADQPRDFEPDARFAYSNTNYIVAGLLLETVTGMNLADNLRTRIVEPLGLASTYFAPDETRSPIGGFSPVLPGGDTDGVSYHALETVAGAAGALVSNASDLANFMRALAGGALLSDATYAEMISGLPADGHSLGVFASDPPSTTGIAHGGAIPGFTAYMQYDPDTEDLVVVLLNDGRSPERLVTDLLEIVGDS